MEAEEPKDRSELQCSASQQSAFGLQMGGRALLWQVRFAQTQGTSSWRALRLGSLIFVWSLFNAFGCLFEKKVIRRSRTAREKCPYLEAEESEQVRAMMLRFVRPVQLHHKELVQPVAGDNQGFETQGLEGESVWH